MKEGAAIVKDDAMRRLRALEMIQMRMVGKTREEIGARFNCDTETVSRTIKWAANTGIIDTAEHQILTDLVPKALKVYSDALDNGDTFAAKHVLDKLADMAERADRRRDKGEDRMLEVWLKEREEKKRADKASAKEGDAVASDAGPRDEDILDAEVLPSETGPLAGTTGPGGPNGRERGPFETADAILRGDES